MGVCMKKEQRKRLKKLEAENQGVMARVMEGMSCDWRLKYLDTLEEVGQLYLALKGIYVESENFDPKSSEANQMRTEFLSLFIGEMMNRKSSGLKSEKEYKNKFENFMTRVVLVRFLLTLLILPDYRSLTLRIC